MLKSLSTRITAWSRKIKMANYVKDPIIIRMYIGISYTGLTPTQCVHVTSLDLDFNWQIEWSVYVQ